MFSLVLLVSLLGTLLLQYQCMVQVQEFLYLMRLAQVVDSTQCTFLGICLVWNGWCFGVRCLPAWMWNEWTKLHPWMRLYRHDASPEYERYKLLTSPKPAIDTPPESMYFNPCKWTPSSRMPIGPRTRRMESIRTALVWSKFTTWRIVSFVLR
jgi:hypothetical protein